MVNRPSEWRHMVVAVTGGAGHVGRHLIRRLAALGAAEVRSLDLAHSPAVTRELLALSGPNTAIRLLNGSVSDDDACMRLMDGADALVHVASAGMSGRGMLDRKLTRRVNVAGTKAMLRASRLMGRSTVRIVYVSTVNVVFGGKTVVDGDESLHLFPAEQHLDWYSRTKGIAESLVLAADGSYAGAGGPELATCSVRPCAIYSADDARHLPRIAHLASLGLGRAALGAAEARQDWIHIDSLVDALVRALAGLGPAQRGIARRQAYFVSDGQVNTFTFLSPLCAVATGRTRPVPPLLRVPVPLVMLFARACELGWQMVGIPPFLTRAEVAKAAVQHTFAVDKAREELGWEPTKTLGDGMAEVVDHYERIYSQVPPVRHPHLAWWLLILVGMALLAACVYQPGAVPGPILWLAYTLFGRNGGVAVVWYLALLAHAVEASIAVRVALRLRLPLWHLFAWTIQTALLGGPSLKLLLAQKPLPFPEP